MWDADGNRYLDYFGSWGPMILGHAHPLVVEAIQHAAAERGASFGASTAAEADLAELVIAASAVGREIALSSVRGRKPLCPLSGWHGRIPSRKYVIKFEGCYHGHSDGLLVKAGSGVATFGLAWDRRACQAGDRSLDSSSTLQQSGGGSGSFCRTHPDEIACVIVEPVVGNMGCVDSRVAGYLEGFTAA